MLLTENGELFECGEAAGDDEDSAPRQNISLEPRRLYSEVESASMTCTHAAVLFCGDRADEIPEKHTVAIEKIIDLPGKVAEVACGNDFTVILVDGAVYTWGAGKHGQLGHGDREGLQSRSRKVRSLTLKLLIEIWH